MKVTEETRISELLEAHPHLLEFLSVLNPKFALLKKASFRKTLGKVATVRAAAQVGGMEPANLAKSIEEELERRGGQGSVTAGEPTKRGERIAVLKEIIEGLHDGGDLEEARHRFRETVADVEAGEIAEMEERLIREGMPVSEVQRLCDVHVGAFREALDHKQKPKPPSGHPVHTYMAENEAFRKACDAVGAWLAPGSGQEEKPPFPADAWADLQQLDVHYTRKENQLFPFLEKHGVAGPSQVMWGIHDEIRGMLKDMEAAASSSDLESFDDAAPAFLRAVGEMIYKEESILFPLALETLSDGEWRQIRKGEAAIGFAFGPPEHDWPGTGGTPSEAPTPSGDKAGAIDLAVGELTKEQLDLLLTHLPVEVSFVDETDTVRYYSDHAHRIFPRSPGVIGRKVQHCHPQKSVHMVQEILDAFRAGTQDRAEFWITLGGKFLYIQYVAFRSGGEYRGCVEVTHDATRVRSLEGERRLLEWSDQPASD